jgi:hypothetical protein
MLNESERYQVAANGLYQALLHSLLQGPDTQVTQDRLFAGLYLWFYASNKDKITTVRISVKGCIYKWKISFKIELYSSDS